MAFYSRIMDKGIYRYLFDFLMVFIAVLSAFLLNSYNATKEQENLERVVLTEILSAIENDKAEFEIYLETHEKALEATQYWKRLILNKDQKFDSLDDKFILMTIDFIPLHNTSGYENLKSRGMHIITNDDVRQNIIQLYEYYYLLLKYQTTNEKLEYHHRLLSILSKYLILDPSGRIVSLESLESLSKEDLNTILVYLNDIIRQRMVQIHVYNTILKASDKSKDLILEHLDQI